MATAKKIDKRKKLPPPVVHSWLELQEALRNCETSEEVREILNDELRGPARQRWLLRINGRLGALRAIEETEYLISKSKE